MERLNLDKQSLRKFGITMGAAFLVIALIVFLKHKYIIFPAVIISAVFFTLAFIIPGILRPAYVIWMRLAYVLSWFNTRLILLAIFYLIFTPIGFIIRITGKDLLDRKIDKNKESYWIKKENNKFNALDYERQF